MYSLIAPGVLLMRKLSLVNKFLLVSFFMLLPLAYIAYFYLGETGKQIDFMVSEREGLRYIQPLLKLSRLTQDHREMTYVIANGDEAPKQARLQIQETIRGLIKEIDSAEREFAVAYGPGSHWPKVTQRLKQLLQADVPTDSEGVFLEHIALLKDIHGLIEWVTLKSNLILDSDATSFHLMDIVTRTVPDLSERLALARGIGSRLVLRGELVTSDHVQMSILEALTKDRYAGLTADLQAVAQESAAAKSGLREVQKQLTAITNFLGDIELMLSPGGASVLNSSTFFQSGTRALSASYAVADTGLPLLGQLLTDRIDRYRAHELITEGVAIVCLLAALYFFTAFYYAVKSGIEFLNKSLARVADGDLTAKIDARGIDEIASVVVSLKEAQERLRTLTLEINRSAEQVFLASNHIADGNENLATRTESQASTLEQTAASLEELTSMVQRNAEAASDANDITQDSARVAESGRAAMKRVAATMAEIESSATKIGDIIALMDSIAFQTNILALNAAVEAARAGDQGRGFAVVAMEVRSLAQRSTDAAKQIKGLIAQTREKVSAGVVSVDDTLQTIQDSLVGIQRVADLMGEIASASREQSDGITQVNRAVVQMDDANQQNAAMVEQATAATESLKNQAQALVSAVGRFKVENRANAEPKPLPKAVVRPNARPLQSVPSPRKALTSTSNDDWAEF